MHAVRLLPLAVCLHASIAAQLPDWASVPSPASATVRLEQSWAFVQDATSITAFSCINRKWSKLLHQGAPVVTILNDAFIVQEGHLVHGYSPRTGSFAPQLTWSPNATVVRPVSPQTWFALVTDGNTVHVFQALDGVWTTYVLSGPPQVTMATKCAVIVDGNDVYAVSAFYGTPVRLEAGSGPAVVQGAFGNCAIVTTPGEVHGFSAYRNQWTTTTAASVLGVRAGHQQAAFALVEEPGAYTFFSGHTGTFQRIATLSASPTVTLDRAVALIDDRPFLHGYSGLLGKQATLPMPSTPAIAQQQFFMVADDGASLHAFSATTGSFAAAVPGALADVTTKAEMAVLHPPSAPIPTLVYSQYRNAWIPTPSLASAALHQTAASVVLVDPNGGIYGLSLRGNQWIHQATPIIDTVFLGTSRPLLEMTVVAKSGNQLWAFNSRTQAWRATTTSAPATMFQGNNTALILSDGSRAYGFSSWSDRWSSVPLAGPVVRSSAQVQSAYVDDGTSVHAYSGIGETSTSHDYPEYWRAASQGARMRIDVAGTPDALGLLLAAPAPASIPIPGLGTLLLDPLTLVVLATPILPPNGIYGLTLQVPVSPGLSGLDLHFQSALLSPPNPYLTNSVVVRIL